MTDQLNIYVRQLKVLPGVLRTPDGQPDEPGVTLQITPHLAPGALQIPLVNVNIRGDDQIRQLALALLEVADQAREAVEGERPS